MVVLRGLRVAGAVVRTTGTSLGAARPEPGARRPPALTWTVTGADGGAAYAVAGTSAHVLTSAACNTRRARGGAQAATRCAARGLPCASAATQTSVVVASQALLTTAPHQMHARARSSPVHEVGPPASCGRLASSAPSVSAAPARSANIGCGVRARSGPLMAKHPVRSSQSASNVEIRGGGGYVPGMTATRRVRVGAAAGLVAALAVGWIATSRMSDPGVVPAASPAPSLTVPTPARCHDPTAREPHVDCTLDGVDIDYRLIRAVSASTVNAVYGDAIGSTTSRPGSGPPRCARGGEDERSWSRPSQPRRVAGRYACRREHGRAAMWWTVADRSLLAHAVSSDDDVSRLFVWWLVHSER